MTKKVIFSSDDLLKCLKKLGLAVSEKAAKIMPATKNVHISIEEKTATLVSSDIETTISIVCDVEATGWPFQIVLPYKYLLQIVAHAGSMPVTIEHPSARVARIIAGPDVYEQKSLEKPEDFIKIPTVPKKKGIELDSKFLHALTLAENSLSTNENQPVLMRVCLDITREHAKVVSTDINIMYIQGLDIDAMGKLEPEQFLLSPKLARITAGVEKITLLQDSKTIIAKASGLTVWMRTVEGKYPAYSNVLRGLTNNLRIGRRELIDAFGKACINANEMMQAVVYLDRGDTILIEMDNAEQACKNRISIPGKYTGNAPRVAVNAKKMITVLEQVETDEVDLHIVAPDKAVIVTSEENPTYMGLVMPLKLD